MGQPLLPIHLKKKRQLLILNSYRVIGKLQTRYKEFGYTSHPLSPLINMYGTFVIINELITMHYYGLKSMVYSDLGSYKVFLSFPGSHPGFHITFCYQASFGCECLISLVFVDLHSSGENWSGILPDAPLLGFVWCFSHDETRVVILGRMTMEVSRPSQPSYRRDLLLLTRALIT